MPNFYFVLRATAFHRVDRAMACVNYTWNGCGSDAFRRHRPGWQYGKGPCLDHVGRTNMPQTEPATRRRAVLDMLLP